MLEGYRTKIVGITMLLVAIANTVKDLFDGGGFDLNAHFIDIQTALTGLGLYFLRSAQDKK